MSSGGSRIYPSFVWKGMLCYSLYIAKKARWRPWQSGHGIKARWPRRPVCAKLYGPFSIARYPGASAAYEVLYPDPQGKMFGRKMR